MSADWPLVSLAELYEIRSGLSKPAKDFGSGFPFLSFKDVFHNFFVPDVLTELVETNERERESCSIQRGDVFLTRTSETIHELGMSCVALKDYDQATFNGFTKRLRPKSGTALLPEYVGYYLRSPSFRKEMMAFSTLMSTRASLNNGMLCQLKLLVPPLEEQKKIAQILKTLDDKIKLNYQINQTLEEMVKAIFKSWFVNFEPVKAKIKAKANGQDPERVAMCLISGKTDTELNQLSSDQLTQLRTTAALFPDELIDSELGLIPKDWSCQIANNIADVAIGKTPPRKEPQWFSKSHDDIKWLSIRDMGMSGVYALNTKEYLTKEAVDKFNVRRIPDNTVLLSFKLTVGRVVITSGEMLSNEAIAHFKLAPGSSVSTEYLYQYLKQFNYSNLASTSSIATAVNSKTIKNMQILIPSNEIIRKFTDVVTPLFRNIKIMQQENESLIATRDTLLPKLLSGEIEVV